MRDDEPLKVDVAREPTERTGHRPTSPTAAGISGIRRGALGSPTSGRIGFRRVSFALGVTDRDGLPRCATVPGSGQFRSPASAYPRPVRVAGC